MVQEGAAGAAGSARAAGAARAKATDPHGLLVAARSLSLSLPPPSLPCPPPPSTPLPALLPLRFHPVCVSLAGRLPQSCMRSGRNLWVRSSCSPVSPMLRRPSCPAMSCSNWRRRRSTMGSRTPTAMFIRRMSEGTLWSKPRTARVPTSLRWSWKSCGRSWSLHRRMLARHLSSAPRARTAARWCLHEHAAAS